MTDAEIDSAIEREMDALIAEAEQRFGKSIDELTRIWPRHPTPIIKRRLIAYLLVMGRDRDLNEKLEVSISVMITLLCEIYCWREKYGSCDETIH